MGDKHSSYKLPIALAVALHVIILIVLVVKFDWFKSEEIVQTGTPGPIINATAISSTRALSDGDTRVYRGPCSEGTVGQTIVALPDGLT